MPTRNRKTTQRTRKRTKDFVAIPFRIAGLALATLGDGTVLIQNALGGNFGEDFFFISADILWSILGLTATEGPIAVGITHGDLTVGEVAEALDAELLTPDNIIQNERNRRPVRRSGVFDGLNSNQSLNDGKMIRTKGKFSVGNDHFLGLWVRNLSGGTLTTGAKLQAQGTIYGRWQR